MSSKEQELVSLIKTGNVPAFDAIYYNYSRRIYAFVLGIIKVRDDANDVVQEVFITLWDKRENLKENLSLKSFLFTIAYNATISYIRKSVKENRFASVVKQHYVPANESADSMLNYNELKDKLDNTVNSLPKRQKEVFVLSREKEMSYKEIAVNMGISVNTVENHMVKSLSFIRKNIK